MLAARGQADEAIAQYQQALKQFPDYVAAHVNLAPVLAARGQVEAAIAHCRRALEIKPDCPKAHYNLAMALTFRRQFDEAIVHYRKARWSFSLTMPRPTTISAMCWRPADRSMRPSPTTRRRWPSAGLH